MLRKKKRKYVIKMATSFSLWFQAITHPHPPTRTPPHVPPPLSSSSSSSFTPERFVQWTRRQSAERDPAHRASHKQGHVFGGHFVEAVAASTAAAAAISSKRRRDYDDDDDEKVDKVENTVKNMVKGEGDEGRK